MSTPPRALVARVAAVLARPITSTPEQLAVEVLEAILVDPLVVKALRDGRYAIDWPDDPAPHESRIVAITRDLLDRIVDRTADLVAGVRAVRADLDRIEAEVLALRNGPGVALVEPIPETTTAPTQPIVLRLCAYPMPGDTCCLDAGHEPANVHVGWHGGELTVPPTGIER